MIPFFVTGALFLYYDFKSHFTPTWAINRELVQSEFHAFDILITGTYIVGGQVYMCLLTISCLHNKR